MSYFDCGLLKQVHYKHNLVAISVDKWLDTIESSFIFIYFISDKLFYKAFLLFKSSIFVPGLNSKPEWILVPRIFTIDILVGSTKRTLDFSVSSIYLFIW